MTTNIYNTEDCNDRSWIRFYDAQGSFRENNFHQTFPCLGAQKVVREKQYDFQVIDGEIDDADTAKLSHHLLMQWFKQAGYDNIANDNNPINFITAVHIFKGPTFTRESETEIAVWKFLKNLHEEDRKLHDWDTLADPFVYSNKFEMSIGGFGHFVPLLSPVATTVGRYFPFPALVFNPHFVFRKLRQHSMFEKWRDAIRARDLVIQKGWINSKMHDTDDGLEAPQYALTSELVFDIGDCPFTGKSRPSLSAFEGPKPPYGPRFAEEHWSKVL